MRLRGLTLCLLSAIALLPVPSRGQSADSLAAYLTFEDPSPLSCLLTWFPPLILQHDGELKQFLQSRTFRQIRRQMGDRRAVDALFVRAMSLTNNNTAMALFLSMVASLEHRMVGLKMPLFQLYLPLCEESEEEFQRRVAHLPSRLYDDSPADPEGDRDKLQHFFGSAFVTYLCESRGSADRVGEFVERGEEAFIVDGVNDNRDRRANRDGQRFGEALLSNNRIYPSRFFRHTLADVPARDSTH